MTTDEPAPGSPPTAEPAEAPTPAPAANGEAAAPPGGEIPTALPAGDAPPASVEIVSPQAETQYNIGQQVLNQYVTQVLQQKAVAEEVRPREVRPEDVKKVEQVFAPPRSYRELFERVRQQP